MSWAGSPTALRWLSLPSPGAFLQSVQLKGGKFLFLIRILMVLIAILYPITVIYPSFLVPASPRKGPRQAWSLFKEWPLDKYERQVAYEEIRTILTQSLDERIQKHLSSPIRIPLPAGDRRR
jgi:hypothetical protein